jgi:proteic killer suppression protein
MLTDVRITKRALKDLAQVPRYLADKLQGWVDAVRERGLEEVRKVAGYHDEPLKGRRTGQRSIRLSRAYRAIYKIGREPGGSYVSIEEVGKHDY